MTLTKEQSKKLREKLPWNYRKVVSERTGCSIPLIHHVIIGRSDNLKVLLALVELADEETLAREKLRTKLASL